MLDIAQKFNIFVRRKVVAANIVIKQHNKKQNIHFFILVVFVFSVTKVIRALYQKNYDMSFSIHKNKKLGKVNVKICSTLYETQNMK